MILIISFTITISWIKYGYNSFQLKDEEIADMIEGITVRVALLPSWVEIPLESLPASDTIHVSAKIWYTRQRAVYI